MNQIERDVFVLRDCTAVAQPIDYVQGTNAIPLIFHVRDYEITENAIARVYVTKPSKKAEYDTAGIEGNAVVVDVKDTMFLEVGIHHLQISITNGEKTLVTFEYPVKVKRNTVAGELPPSENNSNFLDEYLEEIDKRIENTDKLTEQAKEAAEQSEKSAGESEASAQGAKKSAEDAAGHAERADNYATEAESFAHGGTDTRADEDIDNAMFYYEQAKRISQGMQGALLPMGTITFAQLETAAKQAGYMYNISDDFITDDRFKDGAGHKYPAGTNVYCTADELWDCLAGVFVTGVKGAKESVYRQGNVNITPGNIGALAEDGDSANNTVSFTSSDSNSPTAWTNVGIMASREKHSSLFGKISTMFKNVRWIYKMLGTTNISAVGGGTVTGAISTLNTNLAKKQDKLTNPLIQADVVDNLSSTEAKKPLSANQGKILNDKISQKSKVFVQGVVITGNGSNWAVVGNAGKYLVAAQTVRDDADYYITGITKQSAEGLYTLLFNRDVSDGGKLVAWLTWID